MGNMSTMLLDGVDGSLSSKRVITTLAFILCATAFIANLFFGLKIDQFIYDSMSYIAVAGLGATVAEKFSMRSRSPYNPTPQSYRRGTPLPRDNSPEI